MIYIPLNLFVDISNPHVPIGLLIENGLTSPMRNPMYDDFSDHIVADWRPRDYQYIRRRNYLFDIKYRSLLTGNSSQIDYVVNEELNGASLSSTSTTPYLVDAFKEKEPRTGDSSGKTPYFCRGKNLVMLAAIKISDLTSGQVGSTRFGIIGRTSGGSNDSYVVFYVDYWNGSAPRIRIYQNGASGGTLRDVIDASSDIITSASLNKWILMQITLSESATGKYRIIGGQFYDGTPDIPVESSSISGVSLSYYPNGIHIPINRYVSCAFCTCAIYTGNISGSKTGVGINDITWTLFDSEHVCSAYTIAGVEIYFSCTGQVAWEILVGGVWTNTDGSTGSANRVFYDTGTFTLYTEEFSQLRPVLKNSGVLNADTNAVLNWVAITSPNEAGITITPTSGLMTTESGGTDTFTIVLDRRPTANVTIGLSSSDTTEGTVSPSSVTFTSDNWDTPQTITVTGVNDFNDDGDVTYTIITAPATSSDPNYSGMNASDVSVTNVDNDTAGITVTPTSGLVTTELGGTATFTIVLNSRPTHAVVIGLSSSDTTEGTVSPSSVSFDALNWNFPQTVTVTGVDDLSSDGDVAYSIITAPAVSSDPNYSGMSVSDVSVTNIDNDNVMVIIDPAGGLMTTEAGGTDTFTVVLSSQPIAPVIVTFTSSNSSEGIATPPSVMFTSIDWNVPRTITVTGVNDFNDDGDVVYTIITTVVSSDPAFNGVNASDVSVTNVDDDTAGITVTPTSGLVTTESGETDTFSIVLNSKPTANVTIDISSDNLLAGTVSPASVTFTTTTWNVPQIITVIGANNFTDEGDVAYTIVTAPAVSSDPNYSGMNASDVSVTNIDDVSTAGITVTPTSGLVTTESGGTDTFTIVLNSQPTDDVLIGLTSSDATEGTVSPSSVLFTTSNWDTPQTITVTGANDFTKDGSKTYYIITAPASSNDSDYSGMNASNVSVTNLDDDVPGITVTPTSGLVTTEEGGTDTFTIVLNSQPTDIVTIDLSSSNISEGTVSPSSIIFTPGIWNIPQTVTVTGVDDLVGDRDVTYTIITAPASSNDTDYDGMNASNVTVTNLSNEPFDPLRESGLFYTEYFAMAAISGIRASSALFTAIHNVQITDVNTMDNPDKGSDARNSFSEILQNSYESIYSGGLSLDPMRRSFTSLSEYLINKSNLTVDDFFTENNIKVPKVYANLSNLYGYPVSNSNIQEVE